MIICLEIYIKATWSKFGILNFEIDKKKEVALLAALNNSKIRGVKLLVEVAKDVAKYRNQSYDYICEITYQNYLNFFGIKEWV